MAYRDKSQGFGFVYELPKKKVYNFNRQVPLQQKHPEPKLENVRNNLKRLEELHGELHKMLADLSKKTGK